MPSALLSCFAVTAPGIEGICARELEQLGVRPTVEEGGVTWSGDSGLLAAAMLLGAGWTGEMPLTDPMCGSGTIPIEAARLARRMAPGRDRRFAFLGWPETNLGAWKARLDRAREGELPRSPVSITGADRDRGAIDAAAANAERAGVREDLDLRVQPISALAADDSRGLIISNPPYGARVGERDRLRNLYAQLGNVVRQKRPDSALALLLSDRQLEAQVGLPFRDVFETRNGGIAVRFVMAR